MKKIMDKLIAIILVMGMVVCMNPNYTNVTVFAKEEQEESSIDRKVDFMLKDSKEKLSQNEVSEIQNDVKELDGLGLIAEGELTDIHVNDSSTEYVIDYGDVLNNVEIAEKTAEKTVLICEQENISNTVEIYADGSIYLDGKEVKYNTIDDSDISCESFDECKSLNGIVANDSQYWFQAQCPYGTASDYNHYIGTSKCSDINLRNAIKDISMSACIAIIVAACGGGSVAGFVAGAVYTYMCDYRPSATGLSYKAKEYFHKNYCAWYEDGYISPISKKVIKYSYTWYSSYNYTGTTYYKTAYYCKEYY